MELDLPMVKYDLLPYGDWSKTFAYDCSSREATVAIVLKLQEIYGELEEILCIRVDEETNIILSFIEYDNTDDFLKEFSDIVFNDTNRMKFICKDRYISFIIDRNNKQLHVSNSEGFLGKRIYDPEKVYYYRDEYSIVKYDENKAMIYDYDRDKKQWVKSRWRRYLFFYRDEKYYERIYPSEEQLQAYMNGEKVLPEFGEFNP